MAITAMLFGTVVKRGYFEARTPIPSTLVGNDPQ